MTADSPRLQAAQTVMECLFCQIVRKEKDSHIVFEDGACMVFLDHRPLFPGHCLLVSRQHLETLTELPANEISPFFRDVQLVAHAVEEALQAEGTFVAINNRVSQSVPHLHVHIVPRRQGDGLRGFFWPRTRYKDAGEARQIQAAIHAAIEKIQKR